MGRCPACLLKNFNYDGSLYGLPRDNDTKVIFYDEDLFEEAELPTQSLAGPGRIRDRQLSNLSLNLTQAPRRNGGLRL